MSDSARHRLRLLLLENDPEQAKTWGELFHHWGYAVIRASTPDEAERIVETQHLHLVVLDKSMELDNRTNTQGLQVARRIQKKHAGRFPMPIIMLTAYMPESPREVAWWISEAGGGLFDFIG